MLKGLKIKPSLNTGIIWSMIALFGIVDIVGLWALDIKFVPHAFLADMLTVSILLAVFFVYTYIRPSVRIASLAHMGAIFFSFAAVTIIATYLAAALQRPLIDHYLVAADQFLGLDWSASYKWIKDRPALYEMLYFAYSTLVVQIIFLLLYLNFRGRCGRAWEMMWLFMVACILCLLFSVLWPAMGAFGHYQVEMDRKYVDVFLKLHSGALKVIGDGHIEGIIQFPSLHMALGMLLTYVTRGMRILFITFLELNTLLIVSTPVVGGHHFSDLWGGVVLAVVTILIVRRAFDAGLVPDAEKISGT
jgi:hypothetical protein